MGIGQADRVIGKADRVIGKAVRVIGKVPSMINWSGWLAKGAGPAITWSFSLLVLGKMLGAIRDTEEPKGLDGTGTGTTRPAIILCPVW